MKMLIFLLLIAFSAAAARVTAIRMCKAGYLLVLSLLTFVFTARASETTNAVTIPIKLHHQRIVIPARLNGSGPLSFLLDSACTIPTLHPALVDELHLEASGHVTINGIAGDERASTYRGVVFGFDNVTYAPSRVAMIPSEREESRRTDGVLGSGFLRRFVVEMDFKAKCIRLYVPTNYVYAGTGEVVPFRFKAEIPVVNASLAMTDGLNVSGEFELDTGCDSGLCLGDSFVRQNDLLAHVPNRGSEKFGIGGRVETRNATIPKLKLGTVEISDSQADLFLKGSPVDDPLAGHIGMGVLHRFKVILDYSRKQLILER